MKNKYIGLKLFLALGLLASASALFAQGRSVSGKVTDDEARPVPGVNIILKGTSQGTTTDGDGNYTVAIPGDDAVLVFSFIGYTTQEITAGTRSTIDVQLAADVQSLQEVVVTGYSTQLKKDVTGSITKVDVDQLKSVAAPSFAQQLQGRAAGVTVANDKSPGGGVIVRIRGVGTLYNNDPLFVIDGVPTKGNLNNINPNDIESIQVLKDASAASIYGARAANGVIVVTTKKGKAGKPKFAFDAYYGTQFPGDTYDLLNTQQYGELLWTQYRNAGQLDDDTGNPVHPQYGSGATPTIPDYIYPTGTFEGDDNTAAGDYSETNRITRANKAGTDWYDEIFAPSAIQSYQLTTSGGSETGNYLLSGNYFKQDGIVKHTHFERFSVRSNTQFSLANDRVRVGENMMVSYTQANGIDNQDEGNSISYAYRMQPIVPVYDIAGNFAGTKGTALGNAKNPLAILVRNKDNLTRNLSIFGNMYAEVDIIPDLTFRTNIGVDYGTFNETTYTIRDLEASEPLASNSLEEENNFLANWTWTNTLNYTKTIDKHTIGVLVGTEAIETKFRESGARRINFTFDNVDYRYLDAGSGNGQTNYGRGNASSLFSLFGKLNYTFMDRYLFEATVRRDGSSRFSETNRYAAYPAFSVGWRVSQESFLSGVTFLTDLKLRAGWGQTGNQEIPGYNSFSTFRTSPTQSSYDINGSGGLVTGFDAGAYGNKDAKWETTTTTNIGVDFSVLAGKLSGSVDWYTRSTTDMLFQKPLPATQGSMEAPFINIGEMRNRGVDIELGYNSSAMNGALTYGISANVSHYKNEVIQLDDNDATVLQGFTLRETTYTRSIKGQPLSSFYGYIIDGIFQDQSEVDNHAAFGAYNKVGRYKFRDINGDNVINSADQAFIGSPHPDFTYGINVNLGYRNFDFAVFFQGSQGNDLVNYVRRWIDFNHFQGNRSVKMLTDSWSETNRNASLPILDASDNTSGSIPTTYFVEDGSYLRMKNIQIGYTLPSTVLSKIGFNSVRVYVQGQNLWTRTDYSGLDPELTLRDNGSREVEDIVQDRQIGVDEGSYPTAKSVIFGINLGF